MVLQWLCIGVGGGICFSQWFSIIIYIAQDCIYLRIAKTGKSIHRRPAIGIVKIIKIGIARCQYLLIVVYPVMKKLTIGHAIGHAFQSRSGNDLNGIMTLGTIGLEQKLAVLGQD